jgi:UDP-glucose 4-epimerase
MRRSGARTILYASGSGVYGDMGDVEANEQHAVGEPISTYGASKLAGEALIGSYAFMFGLTGCAFRFGNVVGPRQTHGVGFDFARRLLAALAARETEQRETVSLRILGDGSQSKSYIHVSDVVRAVLMAHTQCSAPFQVYNVATGDYITVTEIAQLAIACLGLAPEQVSFEYTGGDRGWKGDVPVVRLNTDRIRATGWRCERSTAEALRQSIRAMLPDLKAGRM